MANLQHIQINTSIGGSTNKNKARVRTFTLGKKSVSVAEAGDVDMSGSLTSGILIYDATDKIFKITDPAEIIGTMDVVPGSRKINTVGPLQGGGDLTGDLTISLPQAGAGTPGYVPGLGGIDAGNAATIAQVNSAYSEFAGHLTASNNPHQVTKTQVGLGSVQNVDTTTTANITDSAGKRFLTEQEKIYVSVLSGVNTGDETKESITTKVGRASGNNMGLLHPDDWQMFTIGITAHAGRLDNPHQVTKAQVGLGHADNTADIDKPVSTLTQAAITAEENARILGDEDLGEKIDLHESRIDNPHEVTKGQVGLGSVQNVDTTTTANITDSSNKRFVTDADLVILDDVSTSSVHSAQPGDELVLEIDGNSRNHRAVLEIQGAGTRTVRIDHARPLEGDIVHIRYQVGNVQGMAVVLRGTADEILDEFETEDVSGDPAEMIIRFTSGSWAVIQALYPATS